VDDEGTPRTFTVETGRASRLDEKIAGIAFLVSALLAMGAFVFISDYSRQGGWDAIAIWNAKARFITRSDAAPLDRIVDPKLAHADYPLLLPAIVARAWQYGGVDSTTISEGIAGLFTFSTFIIAFYAVKLLGGRASAYLMGCVLLSTPFFLVHGASQYADIVLACYITATAAMFTLWDSGIRSLTHAFNRRAVCRFCRQYQERRNASSCRHRCGTSFSDACPEDSEGRRR
jgi:hypothetical protein